MPPFVGMVLLDVGLGGINVSFYVSIRCPESINRASHSFENFFVMQDRQHLW
jgi:hypothetical protein